MWSFTTGNGQTLVVDDNAQAYGRGYNGHGSPWIGNVANLSLNMSNPPYDANVGFVEGRNFVKLTGLTQDTINLQPYPHFGGFFNSLGIVGVQIVGSGPDPLLGDLNGDEVVDRLDGAELVRNLGNTSADVTDGDLNDDGEVSLVDWSILLANMEQMLPSPAASHVSVPEPSSLALLLLGLTATWSSRRLGRRIAAKAERE